MCTIVYIILCIYIYINCIFLNSKFHDRYCFTQHVTDILSWEFMQVPSKSPIHHWVTPFLSINMTVIYIMMKWYEMMPRATHFFYMSMTSQMKISTRCCFSVVLPRSQKENKLWTTVISHPKFYIAEITNSDSTKLGFWSNKDVNSATKKCIM